MAKLTPSEWIRLGLIAVTIIIFGVRMEGRINTTIAALQAECERSLRIDDKQDELQRSVQISVVRIETDINHIKKTVEKNVELGEELLREIRK